MRPDISYLMSLRSSASMMGALNLRMYSSRAADVSSIWRDISSYSFGKRYFMQRSSNSVLIACNPRRYANGAKRYIVSPVILICLFCGMAPRVRMLCRRSAILIRITRTSSERVSRTLRKYSAWRDVSALNTPDILVSPSTIDAILWPKICSISSTV